MSKEFDFYSASLHKGFLPVRVLPLNFLDWFQNVTPSFKEEVKGEIDFNDLKAGIQYHLDRVPLTEVACINSNRQIELHENFNQYLWCVCYALFVIFEENIRKPLVAGSYSGRFNLEDENVGNACKVLNCGFDLLSAYNDKPFFDLPNPEKYDSSDKHFIERANGIYTAAMTFILLHEYAHHYLGHLDVFSGEDESKKDEYTADAYAIDQISGNFSSERGDTYRFGIIAGICSLVLLNSSLKGGDTHPDVDLRLRAALNKLQLDESDFFWGVASLAFRLWSIKYEKGLEWPAIIGTYKELFDLTILKAIDIKSMD